MPTSTVNPDDRPPYPPFTLETATQKVKAAQAGWNTKCVLLILSTPNPIVLPSYHHPSLLPHISIFAPALSSFPLSSIALSPLFLSLLVPSLLPLAPSPLPNVNPNTTQGPKACCSCLHA